MLKYQIIIINKIHNFTNFIKTYPFHIKMLSFVLWIGPNTLYVQVKICTVFDELNVFDFENEKEKAKHLNWHECSHAS